MSKPKANRPPEGVRARHSKTCASRAGGRCDCRPTWQASVWINREQRRMCRTFPSLAAAKQWRREAMIAAERGMLRGASPLTVREVAEAWLEGAREGAIRTRSGDAYKPSAIRSYAQSLRLRVYDALGDVRFAAVRRADLQDLADRLVAEGHAPSTVGCAFTPLRAMYRRAANRGEVPFNPCDGIDLPAVRGGRDRIADPQEAAALLDALPEDDRALWACALYAGLRRGELMALVWDDVDLDLDAGVLRVRRSWDAVEGFIAPKSAKGTRIVPIASTLRALLIAHRLRSGGQGLVFGTGPVPFRPDAIRWRAGEAWKDAGLDRITLHECRHTYASFMIAAGVNAKALSTFMGHANIAITLDKYGHLMPGSEGEAAALLDAFLERSREAVGG